MNVIFIEPSFPDNQRQFVRALYEAGANVIGIGERPKEWLDDDVRRWVTQYSQISSVTDEARLIDTVRGIQGRIWVDRLEATIEAYVMATARAREACGVPGTSVHTTYLCRDKPAMKDALRAAGVPCAKSAPARSGDDVRAFARQVGFPIVVKPAAGAGASGAERVDSDVDLEAAIGRSGVDHGAELAVEEFVVGHEGFYDTITIDGRVVMEFVTHYYPNVLEAMRTRWISPQSRSGGRRLHVVVAVGVRARPRRRSPGAAALPVDHPGQRGGCQREHRGVLAPRRRPGRRRRAQPGRLVGHAVAPRLAPVAGDAARLPPRSDQPRVSG